ncbi:dihydrofolate reductase family protein [Saccharothrix sp. S26]|uniref:dihydrofolate reductase family protein n=1 Tax=Saccharothrix sp. S26 TaxID=2907215 RepID=UPI001F15B97B|nr:dihydrofolate reductase family protein [Saccharothrix sp. S26]MCE7000454.1 dihydrofolate reductase family protein [Saccharothrix sp. S26]
MRKIVVWLSVSLDGFFEAPDGSIDWHLVDDELHEHMNAELSRMGAFLEGRRTYELMADVWPEVGQDPAYSAPMVEFARIWLRMPKVVYSRTLASAGWNATIARSVVPEEVRALQSSADGDLVVGGPNLTSTFRRLDLVDEYRLYVHPVLLGRGRPLFGPEDRKTDLDLVESRAFGNGVALLRYAVHHPPL